MYVYEALTLAISFALLVVTLLKFNQKNKPENSLPAFHWHNLN
ncbi:putative holin-like toxin [Enterococcus ureasiticus]